MRDERALGPTFALADVGFIDFESRSNTSVHAGPYRYAVDADATVLAYAIGDAPVATAAVQTYSDGPLRWSSLPPEIHRHHARVLKGEAVWAAWNAAFDKAVWNYSTVDFPLLLPRHIVDVQVQATPSGLPPDLAGAAVACGGGSAIHKDKSGAALIDLFCVPGAIGTPETHSSEWAAFLAYAGQDIVALRAVFLRTRQLPYAEWQEYWAMEAVNERGIGIDITLASHAAELARVDRERSRGELSQLTEGAVTSVDEIAKLTAWLLGRLPAEGRAILLKREEEVDEDGNVTRPAKHQLTRAHVARLIAYAEANIPADTAVLRALQIRLYGGSKTPTKFLKMLDQHVDGVLHGQYVFNGAAQTGRMSSRGAQIHNLARDPLPNEYTTIEAVLSGCRYDDLLALSPDPVARQLSLLIRPTLVPQDDNVFVWSDWSQIEARVLPWLAGGDPGALQRLEIFREVDVDPSLPDLYTRTAAAISGIPISAVTPAIRQRGKVAELALGFAGGLGALQAMGVGYNMYLAEEDARDIVHRWRAANEWCVRFWDRVEAAALSALQAPEITITAGRLAYTYMPNYLGGTLVCQLPSGRCLSYRAIRFERVEDEDDDGNITVSTQLRFSRARGRMKLWRGIFTENAVQAVAADVLRGTLVRLEQQGFCTRVSTHDEVLVECAPHAADHVAHLLKDIMLQGFQWSAGLPLMSEETIAPYYSKHKGAYYRSGELNSERHATTS